MIVGGREAGKVADRLKSRNVPVVLRLNFPAEPKVPTEEEYRETADRAGRAVAAPFPPPGAWQEQVATASALAKAGVSFAFATEGIDRLERTPVHYAS